jgi:Cu/Ag efflux protein CusF
MRFLLLCLFLCVVAGSCATSPNKEPVTRHRLHGVIRSVDASAKTVTVAHDKIEGFMGAMTMEYPVKDAQELKSLRQGETIDGIVFVQDTDFWLGEIKEKK